MYNFNYVKASSVQDAVSQNANSAEARYLAGGMTLIPVSYTHLTLPTSCCV